MLNIKNQFLKLSSLISAYIKKQNNHCVKRKYKTNMSDAFLFRMLYSNINSNQETITASINQFRYSHNMPIVSRTCLIDREKKLKSSMLKDLCTILDSFISENGTANNQLPKSYVFLAADGVQSNMNKTLKNNGYKINKNEQTCNVLNIGLYNLTYDFPEKLDTVKHQNEQKALIDAISNGVNYVNTVIITDKFFWGHPIFKAFIDNKINFICRIKKNSSLIDENVNDSIIQYNNTSLRVITYYIENEAYYLVTDLLNTQIFSIETAQQSCEKCYIIRDG